MLRVSSVLTTARNELLKLAACIEEHFLGHAWRDCPSTDAVALITKKSSTLRSNVAHGIRTQVNGKEVRIGSDFLFDDEGVCVQRHASAPTASIIYMAEDGKLVGAIRIVRDSAGREEAAGHLAVACIVKRFVMLTGDSENVAANGGAA